MSDPSMDPKIEQLLALKGMTLAMGCLHEAQVLQLKSYPILLPNVKKWDVEVDPDKHLVTYNLKGKANKLQLMIMRDIVGYIRRYLLWDDSKVVFKLNGKVRRY